MIKTARQRPISALTAINRMEISSDGYWDSFVCANSHSNPQHPRHARGVDNRIVATTPAEGECSTPPLGIGIRTVLEKQLDDRFVAP
jgi:hypothetical protein